MRLLIAAVLAIALIPGSGASAATDRSYNLTAEAAPATVTWQGQAATGTNQNYFENHPLGGPLGLKAYTCNKEKTTYCETVLLSVTNEVAGDDGDGRLERKLQVVIDEWTPVEGPVTDFDLVVYNSDAHGTQGEEAAQSSQGLIGGVLDDEQVSREAVEIDVTTTRTTPTVWYLVHVVYYQSVETGYRGMLTW